MRDWRTIEEVADVNKPIEYWLWWITDETTGKRRRTAYRMTRHEALSRFPGAEPVFGTMEIRNLPERDEEQHRSGGRWTREKGKA